MKSKKQIERIGTSISVLFLLSLLAPSNVQGDEVKARSTQENGCRVGNTVFSIGDLVGSVSLSCYDEGSYKGQESFCGENGSMYYMEKTLRCPNEAPYCFQCGEESYGAAKCLSYYSAAPEGCSLGGAVQKLSGFNRTEALVPNGYCGRNSADNSTLCDPNATACTSDFDCIAQSNYSSCLMECGPQIGSTTNETEVGFLGERSGTSGVSAPTSAAFPSHHYHSSIVFMCVCSIFGFVGVV